ncbi:hypothetical protein DM02DRAFT_719266 [Periconia macrospinosa]|uniref:Uncharacterized protein n=1 Tax=Periconia macrospinosa TaxID=97972 RepID=A0A2V1DK56_9PLEO|nr:hypothetical protein DM02DRAFT_719266 [Periconia macrospinosa]
MVYITSDLFGSNISYERPNFPLCTASQTWDDMTNTQHTAGLGKRKRRPEDDSEKTIVRYGFFFSPLSWYLILIWPIAALQSRNSHSPVDTEQAFPLAVATPTYVDAERRPVKQTRRSYPKLHKQPSHFMDVEPTPTSDQADTNTHNSNIISTDLRPCHSCRSVPKRKQDLENYMECKHCEGRTCFICARECITCSKAICNRCIVEVGEDGDSWCLECHQRQINS